MEMLNELADEEVAEAIRDNAIKAAGYENEVDALFRDSLRDIMKGDDIKAIIKYKEIYERIEEISDRCMDAMDVINDIVIRYRYMTSNGRHNGR